MIELVLEESCIKCNICVKVCPNDVFDAVDDGIPVATRQEECHTCYMCEALCPKDALYVSPLRTPDPSATLEWALASGHIGSFRRALGFDKHKPGSYAYSGPAIEGAQAQPNPNDKVRVKLAEVSQRSLIVPSTQP